MRAAEIGEEIVRHGISQVEHAEDRTSIFPASTGGGDVPRAEIVCFALRDCFFWQNPRLRPAAECYNF